MNNKKIIFFSLISFLLTGCFKNEPDIKKINVKDKINLTQENKYIENQVEKMIKMVYENNFVQQKISDAIDDLGTSTINNYDNTVYRAVKIPFDDIDRISNNFIKIYNTNHFITLYKLTLIDYDNNMIKLNIRKDIPILYYYIINKNTGIGKLVTQDIAIKFALDKNSVIYRITNHNENGVLYIEKYNKIDKNFDTKSKINLNKLNDDYVNNIDNIIITIKKEKDKDL